MWGRLESVRSYRGLRTVADPAMGGPDAPPPIDQKLGLVMAERNSLPQTRGKFSRKSLNFGHILHEN